MWTVDTRNGTFMSRTLILKKVPKTSLTIDLTDVYSFVSKFDDDLRTIFLSLYVKSLKLPFLTCPPSRRIRKKGHPTSPNSMTPFFSLLVSVIPCK